jgi:uncharacterized protein (DUF58 family)
MPDSSFSSSKIQLNSPILPGLTFIILILVIFDGYRGWLILFVSLGGVWILATIWAYALSRGLQIRREMRLGWAQVGDRLEERFTLINGSHFPAPWVEVIGQTNLPDYWANQVRDVKRKGKTRWQIRGICSRRGLYILGPTTIRTNDPFGFYSVTLINQAKITLVVTPPVVPLPTIQVSPGGRAGDGILRVKALDQDINSSGVRPYVSGDSKRKIHWPTTARKNEFYVREFERSPAGDWWIILDLEKGVQVGKGQNATHEHAIILGASLTDYGMRTGRSIGMAMHGESLIWHRSHLSDQHKWDIFRSLALVETGEVPLGELLELIRPSVNKKSSLIIITPNVEGKWLTALSDLQRLGVVPTLLLFDVQSFGSKNTSANLVNDMLRMGINYQLISKEILDGRSPQNGDNSWDWRDGFEGSYLRAHKKENYSWQDIG